MYHTNFGLLTAYNISGNNNGRGNPCCVLRCVNYIIMLDHRTLLPIRLNNVSNSLVFMLFRHTKNSMIL